MMRAAVSLLFLLSGAVGLVYEVVWAKYLALALGSTAVAQSLVLAAFLGGLSLGNALLGARADRTPNPLRLYALLEAGVAVLGLLSPLLLSALADASLSRAQAMVPAGLILLAPTVLMGGTLPALSRLATSDLSELEQAVSWLYFLNSAGAAAGTLVAGFVLLPLLGLDGALLAGGTLNAAVAGLAWLLSGRLEGGRLEARAPGAPAAAEDVPVSAAAPGGPVGPADVPILGVSQDRNAPGTAGSGIAPAALRVVLAAAFLSGLVSLCYEVAWIRLLALSLGSSTYSFTLMLAAFVAGIALGSLVVSRGWLARKDPVLLFGLAELGVLLSILLTFPFYERLPFFTFMIDQRVPVTPRMFYLREALRSGMVLALTLGPTSFLGATLPLASRAAARGPEEVGAAVGRVFALNTLGNVLGALCAGLWLLPALGLQGLVIAGLAVNLALGCAALCVAEAWAGWARFLVGGLCAVLFAAFAGLGPSWSKPVLTAGLFRNPDAISQITSFGFDVFRKAMDKTQLLYYKDDREATVTVESQENNLSLKVNGKTDASSYWDMPTQLLLAHVPLLLRPGAKDVLLIGLGSGVTAGAALRHPIDRLDVAEITPAVAEGARFFASFNGGALDDPRLHLTFEDGKAFLKRGTARYDLILTEPSNPWIAGVGNLFSVEYFAESRRRLKPGGVAVQWFHLYRMDDETLRVILRGFVRVFPHVTLWHTQPDDILLLGSEAPLPDDFPALEEAFGRPDLSWDMRRIGIYRPSGLLALQIASDPWVRAMAGSGRVNTDRRPVLEYEAPRVYFLRKTSWLVYDRDQRADPGRGEALALDRYLKAAGRRLGRDEIRDLMPFLRNGSPAFRRRLFKEWISRWPADEPRYELAKLEFEEGNFGPAREALAPILRKRPLDVPALALAADVEIDAGRDEEAARILAASLKARGTDKALAHKKLSFLRLRQGDGDGALDELDLAAQAALAAGDREGLKSAELWMEAASAAVKMYDSLRAMAFLRKVLEREPANAEARKLYGQLEELERKYPSKTPTTEKEASIERR